MQELEEKARDFLDQFHPPDKRLDEPERPKIDLSSLFANGVKWEGLRSVEFEPSAPDPPWVRQYYEPICIPITYQTGNVLQYTPSTATVAVNDNPYAAVTAVQDPMEAMSARIHDLEAQLQSLMDERGRYL